MLTKEELETVILEKLAGAENVVVTDRNGSLYGSIQWKGFEGKQPEERAAIFRQLVRKALGSRGLNVGPFFLFAPNEVKEPSRT